MHENQDDEKTIQKIKESLDYLDSSIEVKKPELMQLFSLVNEVEEKKKSSSNTQFITFIIVAIAAVFLETYSYHRSIVFFVVLQAIVLLCAIPAVILFIRKKNRQVSA
jgi:hypothetical protein